MTSTSCDESARWNVRSGNFLRFWTGQSLAQFAANFTAVAIPAVAITMLHASEEQVGYLNAANTAAFLIVGLPAGAWIDRWFKRKVMIVADLVRVVAAMIIPALWFLGWLQLWHMYVVGFVIGLATVFFDVAYQSFIPALVSADEIATANSRLETTSQVARLGGPPLGGVLIRVVGAPVVLIIDVLGYVASLFFLLITKDHECLAVTPREDRNLIRETRAGVAFVARHQAIRLITLATALSNVTASMFFVGFPLLVLRILGFQPDALGLTMSVGGLLGAMLTSRFVQRMGEKPAIVLGMILAAVGMVITATAGMWQGSPALATLCVGEFVMSVGILVYNLTQVSMRQRLCPSHLLGRMNASIRFVVWGVMPIASILGGWLAKIMGVLPMIWLTSTLGFLAVIPLIFLLRVRIDEPAAAG